LFRFISTVDGVENLNRAFNRTEGYVADMRNFAPAVSQEFYQIETEQFASEGASGASGKWTPLSPAYERFKAVAFPGETILRATGHMEASLTDPDALDAIFFANADEITLGTKDPKAVYHHRGAGRLPSRPVISMSEPQKRRIQKAIQRELVEFTRRAGFHVEERAA
jgi:phage gpG-like protein